MKIVITGSEGFIGRAVKDSLNGHELILYDLLLRKNINTFKLNGDEDFVIHLAAKTGVRDSVEYKDLYFLNNYVYSKHIFDECDNYGIRCIYASSSCAMFPDLSPYGLSKKMMEEVGKNHTGLRFTNVFNIPPRKDMLLDKLLSKNLSYITNHKRDFVYLGDVVKAINLFLNKEYSFNKVFNVSYGKSINVSDIVSLFNVDVPIKKGYECEVQDNCLSNEDIKQLGWSPSYSIIDYLKKSI